MKISELANMVKGLRKTGDTLGDVESALNQQNYNVGGEFERLIDAAERGDIKNVSDAHKDILKKSAQDLNRRAALFKLYNNKKTTVEKARVLRHLHREWQRDSKIFDSINQVEPFQEKWDKDVRGAVRNVFGGRVPPDVDAAIDATISNFKDKKLYRVLNDVQESAFRELTARANDYRGSLDDGDIIKAREDYVKTKQTIAMFRNDNIIDKDMLSAIEEGVDKDFNRNMYKVSIGNASYTMQTDGVRAALDDLKNSEKLIDTKHLTPQSKARLASLKRLWEEAVKDDSVLIDNTMQSVENSVDYGLGNYGRVQAQAGDAILRLDKKIKETTKFEGPSGKGVIKYKKMRDTLSAYIKVSGLLSSAVSGVPGNRGQQMLTGGTLEEMVDAAGFSNEGETRMGIQMLTRTRKLYGFDVDPIKGYINLHRRFNPKERPTSVTGVINEELDITGKVLGTPALSKTTKGLVVGTMNRQSLSEEDTDTKEKIMGAVNENNIDLTMEAAAADKEVNSINNGLVALNGLTSLTPLDSERFKVLYAANSEVRSAVAHVSKILGNDLIAGEITDIAKKKGLSVGTTIFTLASDIAWSARSGQGEFGHLGVSGLRVLSPRNSLIGGVSEKTTLGKYLTGIIGGIDASTSTIGGSTINKKSEEVFSQDTEGAKTMKSLFGSGALSQGVGDDLRRAANLIPGIDLNTTKEYNKKRFYEYLSEATGYEVSTLLGGVTLRQGSYLDNRYFLDVNVMGVKKPLIFKGSRGVPIALTQGEVENIANIKDEDEAVAAIIKYLEDGA